MNLPCFLNSSKVRTSSKAASNKIKGDISFLPHLLTKGIPKQPHLVKEAYGRRISQEQTVFFVKATKQLHAQDLKARS